MHRATPPLCLGAPQGVAEGVAGGVADSCGHLPGACPPWGHFSLTPEGRVVRLFRPFVGQSFLTLHNASTFFTT